MNWLKKAKELKAKAEALLATAKKEERVFTADEQEQFDGFQTEIENCLRMHDAEKASNAVHDRLNEPDPNDPPPPPAPLSPNNVHVKPGQEPRFFDSLGEQLKAIKNAERGIVDERLIKVNNASGMNTDNGKDGGFAVQTDFAGAMLDSAVKEDPIVGKCDSYNLSSDADNARWLEIDEESIDSAVYGGVKAYWRKQAGTVSATQPKLKERELSIDSMMVLAYTTEEMEQDSSFTSQLIERAANSAIRRALADSVINGTGVGMPLGWTKTDALISVPKESGQAADTVTYENIVKMYHRALNRSEGNYVWLMHPDVHEQLEFLKFPVGTGGVPVYLSASREGDLPVLKGLPIFESDLCGALGDVGDINFVDLSKYMLLYKGGMKKDTSIHVRFLYAENAYRFMLRVGGAPNRVKSTKIKNSTKTRSPFVALAARA